MKAVNKDLIREILKTKSKFISLMIIMFLGVFVFVGLKETSPAMINTYNKTLEAHKMYDLRITNSFGINEDDFAKIKSNSDISELETYYVQSAKLDDSKVNIESLPEKLATPKLIEGRLPESADEIVLVDSLDTKYKIGDIVAVSLPEGRLKNTSFKVVGYVQGADHIEVSKYNLANKDYFVYIKKENFSIKNYSGVNVKLKGINYDYSDKKYIEEVNKKRDTLIFLLEKQRKVDEENFANSLKDSEKKLSEAQKTLDENSKQLELLKNFDVEKYNIEKEKLSEEQKTLAENITTLESAKKSFEDSSYPRFSVENIRGLQNYAQFIDSADSLAFVANVFSIFLFAVAVLVSLTTLSRMIDENRTNIGTLKALGYSNKEISRKYFIYGATSTILGTIFGVIAAYLVIVPIIYNSYARFFTLKNPQIVYSIHIITLAFIIAILCNIISIYIPLRKNLKEKTADLLRPKAPSNGSRIFLENINFIWKRLTFLQKVTFRNIFRYKVRMIMTIFGVLGSLALMFIGFAIRFGVVNISNEQFKTINKVDIVATYNPYITSSEVENIKKEIEDFDKVVNFTKVNIQKATFEKNNEVVDIAQLITLDKNNYKDYITLLKDDENIELPEDAAVVNEKLAYLHNLKVGDSFTVVVNDKNYTLKVGAINKNYFGHILYINRGYYEKVFNKKYSDNSFLIKMNASSTEISSVANTLAENKNIINISDNSNIQESLDNFIEGIDIIVVVMVLCSLTLAIVVLYNLINVNVSERLRELSTIKVLGFYANEVTIYVFREIFYLGLIGIIIGNYIAYKLYLKIILELAARQMMFSSKVPIVVYILSSGITILIIVFVMLIMHYRLKKVNMVEALKAVE